MKLKTEICVAMTKNYFQFTLAQRYKIEALKAADHSQSSIANIIGVNKSTVCRELKRNVAKRGKGAKVYRAKKAQLKTDNRHKIKPKQVLFSTDLKNDVVNKMTVQKLSPELISAVWKKEDKRGVSHESIYKFIWQSKFSNRKEHRDFKKTYKLLKHGTRRRKRGNYKDNRGLIPNRVSIEKRSKLAQRRKRLGDIEVDLIIGKNHQGGLLVMLDRASLVTTIDKISSKKPKHIKKLILKRMKNNKHLKTMTFDNDQAFGLHQQIARELQIKTFFTRPYTSQDKGSVENRNGVIRRFYPKKTDFTKVSTNDVKKVETIINNRPVRKFDYKTPNEVHLLKTKVALIA
jgi:IS30 family transposase